jgi:hypothetical protein
VHVLGKLGGREAVTAAVSYGPRGHLALLVDQATRDKFLVDTGSAFSIIPYQSTDVPQDRAYVQRTARLLRAGEQWSGPYVQVAAPSSGPF